MPEDDYEDLCRDIIDELNKVYESDMKAAKKVRLLQIA